MKKSIKSCSEQIEQLKQILDESDAILIGAGAGLSTSAGLEYSGARFNMYFNDFYEEYGISDMYSGGFCPYQTLEEYWAWWSRQIFWNRYVDAPKPVYRALLELVQEKDYFIITTNVDHQFQKAGFEKKRLFYTQSDYGLWQCSKPCHQATYDNEELVRRMILEQKNLHVPAELIPRCPRCGEPMTMNLRCDATFVQDEGWYVAKRRYQEFIDKHKGQRIVFLELGVGRNTPAIIKYPFWRMTVQNPKATYICLNYGEAVCPQEIEKQSLCINDDIGRILEQVEEFGVA